MAHALQGLAARQETDTGLIPNTISCCRMWCANECRDRPGEDCHSRHLGKLVQDRERRLLLRQSGGKEGWEHLMPAGTLSASVTRRRASQAMAGGPTHDRTSTKTHVYTGLIALKARIAACGGRAGRAATSQPHSRVTFTPDCTLRGALWQEQYTASMADWCSLRHYSCASAGSAIPTCHGATQYCHDQHGVQRGAVRIDT